MSYRFDAEYLGGTGYDQSTDSLEYASNELAHVAKFTGNLWFVSDTHGNDSNDGRVNTPFATITHAVSQASADDRIYVEAGTYAEDVDLDKNGLELWCEAGAIIQGQTNEALTLSGNYCVVSSPRSALRVEPVVDKSAVKVTGSWNYLHDIRVPAGSSGAIGYEVTGNGCVLNNCRCSNPKTAAFKITGDTDRLVDCCTGGDTAQNSIGYWISGTADKFRIKNCGSQGHAQYSFYVESTCSNGHIDDCYSGRGDGMWYDPGHNAVWTNWDFDNVKNYILTFSGATTAYNLFKVTGTVEVKDIYGIVETAIPNTSSNIHLSLYSTGGETDITNNVSAPDIDSAPVGSALLRIGDVSDTLIYSSSASPGVAEGTYKDLHSPLTLVADNSNDTYIRVNISSALASGAIHWHCSWMPLSDSGWLEAV